MSSGQELVLEQEMERAATWDEAEMSDITQIKGGQVAWVWQDQIQRNSPGMWRLRAHRVLFRPASWSGMRRQNQQCSHSSGSTARKGRDAGVSGSKIIWVFICFSDRTMERMLREKKKKSELDTNKIGNEMLITNCLFLLGNPTELQNTHPPT